MILVDASLVETLAKLAPRFETVRHFVVMGDADLSPLPGAISYEELLARQPAGFDYPEIDDRAAAGLCYTSGTTGNPKGVLYSHRSNILHALGQCLADALGTSRADRVMPVVPMFHANAWGLPYASAMVGADLIMPSRFLQAEPLARLIEDERVTVAGAVPTIWMDLLRYADEHKPDLSSIRLVACGGSAVPRALMEAFQERHGMRIIQAWGMTETSPLGSVAHPPPASEGEEHWGYRATAGRLIPLVRGAARRRRRRGPAVGRRGVGRAAGARPVDRQHLLRGPRGRRQVRRRLAAHRRRRLDRPRAATSASPTAPRTSSSPAASGSPPSTSRSS